MHNTSTVLILGARGRFGRAAAQAFADAGWKVIGQLRPGAETPRIPGVQWLPAEPGDTATLAASARAASVVVQGLSPVYTNRAWRTEVPRLTQAAIDISRELGALLMLPASVYNFGDSMPARLEEDTPQRPSTAKGRMRQASEQQILAATRDGRMQAVVIRGGDFFGSGTGSWFDQVMVKKLHQGAFTYPGRLDVPTSWAYLPDMARSFVAVAQQRERLPAFETLHFAGHQLTGRQWADVVAQVAREQGWLPAGRDLKVTSVSWTQMRLLGLVVPVLAALCEMRYLWRLPYRLVNKRMLALAGPEPQTPFPVALRKALAEPQLPAAAQAVPHPARAA